MGGPSPGLSVLSCCLWVKQGPGSGTCHPREVFTPRMMCGEGSTLRNLEILFVELKSNPPVPSHGPLPLHPHEPHLFFTIASHASVATLTPQCAGCNSLAALPPPGPGQISSLSAFVGRPSPIVPFVPGPMGILGRPSRGTGTRPRGAGDGESKNALYLVL